jgi:chaperone modulatory protein CbpM
MRTEILEAHWLGAQAEVTLEELAEATGLPKELIGALVEHGALAPIEHSALAPIEYSALPPLEPAARTWKFTSRCIATVRAAGRLRDDFELDTSGMSLALRLLERIESLEAEVRRLRAANRR